jgi:hypothetical protein
MDSLECGAFGRVLDFACNQPWQVISFHHSLDYTSQREFVLISPKKVSGGYSKHTMEHESWPPEQETYILVDSQYQAGWKFKFDMQKLNKRLNHEAVKSCCSQQGPQGNERNGPHQWIGTVEDHTEEHINQKYSDWGQLHPPQAVHKEYPPQLVHLHGC